MDHGKHEINIPRVLDNLRIGERYTFYHVNAPNVGIRATLINIIPGHGNIDDRIRFRPDGGAISSVPLERISRITQLYIAPRGDGALAREINSYIGGRKKRKKRKSRKTKRRRRKTKRRRRKTKRRVKRRCKTRRR